ncbi:MAG: DNA repair protein RecO [Candidatus Nomurabacteria bacterium]|jgi:DNA repair protein RecO (recombination protein O)|nr:DNA repair protein RecO [Candidatus Nomurabacteria bacterium]
MREVNEFKGLAMVLRGTNYGEADRILQMILEDGRQESAIVKGVRRSKSKLAGGTQVLAVNLVNLHFSRSGKMATVTGAKMVMFFDKILADYGRLQMAYELLRLVSRRAEGLDDARIFQILQQALTELNNLGSLVVVRTWFLVNFYVILGENNGFEVDVEGFVVAPDLRYGWDLDQKGLVRSENGVFGVDEIKFLRCLVGFSLGKVMRIRDCEEFAKKISREMKM